MILVKSQQQMSRQNAEVGLMKDVLRTLIKALTTIIIFLLVLVALFAFFDPFRLAVLPDFPR
jgi:hypothetical protein